jgi:mannose-6-phosphate isomerase
MTLPKRTDKPWGYEELWARNGRYAAKMLFIRAGCRLSRQYHIYKHETLRVISGTVDVEVDIGPEFEIKSLSSGEVITFSPGEVHRLEAVTDTLIVEVSTPDLDDVVRLEDDYGRV